MPGLLGLGQAGGAGLHGFVMPLFPHRPYQKIGARNPNDPGESGITVAVRERIELPKAARINS